MLCVLIYLGVLTSYGDHFKNNQIAFDILDIGGVLHIETAESIKITRIFFIQQLLEGKT